MGHWDQLSFLLLFEGRRAAFSTGPADPRALQGPAQQGPPWPGLLPPPRLGDSHCFQTTVWAGTGGDSFALIRFPEGGSFGCGRDRSGRVRATGRKRQGPHPTAVLSMWEVSLSCRASFRRSGWAWVSPLLIEFRVCRREQKKYCSTLPGPSPRSAAEGAVAWKGLLSGPCEWAGTELTRVHGQPRPPTTGPRDNTPGPWASFRAVTGAGDGPSGDHPGEECWRPPAS